MQVDVSKLSGKSNPLCVTQILEVEEKLFFLQNLIPQKGPRGPPCQLLVVRICSERSHPWCLLQARVARAVAGLWVAAGLFLSLAAPSLLTDCKRGPR